MRGLFPFPVRKVSPDKGEHRCVGDRASAVVQGLRTVNKDLTPVNLEGQVVHSLAQSPAKGTDAAQPGETIRTDGGREMKRSPEARPVKSRGHRKRQGLPVVRIRGV